MEAPSEAGFATWHGVAQVLCIMESLAGFGMAYLPAWTGIKGNFSFGFSAGR